MLFSAEKHARPACQVIACPHVMPCAALFVAPQVEVVLHKSDAEPLPRVVAGPQQRVRAFTTKGGGGWPGGVGGGASHSWDFAGYG
jgi:hypothetical protein